MLGSILNWIWDNKEWIFSGIGIPVLMWLFRSSSRASSENEKAEPDEIVSNNGASDDTEVEPYKVSLGRRVKYIRKNVLDINPRKFSDLFGIEEVEALEAYESGEVEFPSKYVDLLCKFYFVNKEYIQGESDYIFKTFCLINSEDSEKLITEGFRPYILCKEGDDWLKGKISFYKKEKDCHRLVFSDRSVSFKSSGGGKSNLMNMLIPFIKAGKSEYDASILSVDESTWGEISKCLYHRKGFLGFMAHFECQDIFHDRYEECKKQVERWKSITS